MLNSTITVHGISVPDEVFMVILSKLEKPRDLYNVLRVAKRFKQLSERDDFWQLLAARLFNVLKKPENLPTWRQYFHSLYTKQQLLFKAVNTRGETPEKTSKIIDTLLTFDNLGNVTVINNFLSSSYIQRATWPALSILLERAIINEANLLLKSLFLSQIFIDKFIKFSQLNDYQKNRYHQR